MAVRATRIAAMLLSVLAPAAVGQSRAVPVDHIIVSIDTLERGIRLLAERTGVVPILGGTHPGRGTQNALMSLGNGVYLELLAPNFADTAAASRVGFFAQFRDLYPYGWAMRAENADSQAASGAARGLRTGPVQAGSRARPDGRRLTWRTLDPWPLPRSGFLPFFIEWGAESPHPSTETPGGCTLARVGMLSPTPDSLRTLLERADVMVPVSLGTPERLEFDLECPNGRVRIR